MTGRLTQNKPLMEEGENKRERERRKEEDGKKMERGSRKEKEGKKKMERGRERKGEGRGGREGKMKRGRIVDKDMTNMYGHSLAIGNSLRQQKSSNHIYDR